MWLRLGKSYLSFSSSLETTDFLSTYLRINCLSSSFPLVCMSVFMSRTCHFNYCSFVIKSEIWSLWLHSSFSRLLCWNKVWKCWYKFKRWNSFYGTTKYSRNLFISIFVFFIYKKILLGFNGDNIESIDSFE